MLFSLWKEECHFPLGPRIHIIWDKIKDLVSGDKRDNNYDAPTYSICSSFLDQFSRKRASNLHTFEVILVVFILMDTKLCGFREPSLMSHFGKIKFQGISWMLHSRVKHQYMKGSFFVDFDTFEIWYITFLCFICYLICTIRWCPGICPRKKCFDIKVEFFEMSHYVLICAPETKKVQAFFEALHAFKQKKRRLILSILNAFPCNLSKLTFTHTHVKNDFFVTHLIIIKWNDFSCHLE